jgi:hypothetical protein
LPILQEPVMDWDFAFNNQNFMKLVDVGIKPEYDIVEYKNGWLMNDNKFLSVKITQQECIKNMESSLRGEFNGSFSERSQMIDYTR